ncbi:putative hscarg dehydrogenase [Lophiostoma macrostomum CBS 122681]|uniref:Putative hscarg dehydrogenase n=1 Tax=Lophiostoma macrostomum CBS 122681 TaxID=1314788 RepID=A0A6A6TCB7_9PLEO|nr:putative hscarg dehydrogenase [Lophiostoma macrostomum CBS 122681]
MTKLLAVFGATGQQGSSVVDNVLADPELSQQYKLRAITRDVNSDKAQHLKKKVEVVQGDVYDRASLENALAGVHTVFIVTTPSFSPDAFTVEYNSAKLVADVAVEKGASYIIFSTLPSITELSGGKYTKIVPFDAKAKAEQYIRTLPIKSAFVSLGFFMENFHAPAYPGLLPAGDGTWILPRPCSPQSPLPLVAAVSDTGKFVGAILAEPDKYAGKTFCAAEKIYTMEEACGIISKSTGKTVGFKQVTVEEWRKGVDFLPEPLVELFAEGFVAQAELGYWGPDSEKLVAWAKENVRGKLIDFEEYLATRPLQLPGA